MMAITHAAIAVSAASLTFGLGIYDVSADIYQSVPCQAIFLTKYTPWSDSLKKRNKK